MRTLVPLSLLVLAAACHGSVIPGDDGPDGARSFQVSGSPAAIDVRGPDDVEVTRGTAFAVSATGPRAALDALTFTVDHGTLVIDRKPDTRTTRGATVRVTMPALAGVAIEGSGDVRVDQLDGTRFAATQSGSGGLTIKRIQTAEASFHSSGSGNLRASGHVGTLTADLSGSGDANLDAVTTDHATLSTSGTGDIELGDTRSASGATTGTGDIKVAGHPTCTISKSGTGDVKCG